METGRREQVEKAIAGTKQDADQARRDAMEKVQAIQETLAEAQQRYQANEDRLNQQVADAQLAQTQAEKDLAGKTKALNDELAQRTKALIASKKSAGRAGRRPWKKPSANSNSHSERVPKEHRQSLDELRTQLSLAQQQLAERNGRLQELGKQLCRLDPKS